MVIDKDKTVTKLITVHNIKTVTDELHELVELYKDSVII